MIVSIITFAVGLFLIREADGVLYVVGWLITVGTAMRWIWFVGSVIRSFWDR